MFYIVRETRFLRQPYWILFDLVHPSSITYHACSVLGCSLFLSLQGHTGRQNNHVHSSILKNSNKENGSPFWPAAQHPIARSHLWQYNNAFGIAVRNYSCVLVCLVGGKIRANLINGRISLLQRCQAFNQRTCSPAPGRKTLRANSRDSAHSFGSELIMNFKTKHGFPRWAHIFFSLVTLALIAVATLNTKQ